MPVAGVLGQIQGRLMLFSRTTSYSVAVTNYMALKSSKGKRILTERSTSLEADILFHFR